MPRPTDATKPRAAVRFSLKLAREYGSERATVEPWRRLIIIVGSAFAAIEGLGSQDPHPITMNFG